MIPFIDLFLTLLVVAVACGSIAWRIGNALRRTRRGAGCAGSCGCSVKGNPGAVLSARSPLSGRD